MQDSELEPAEGAAGELRELNRSARGGGLVARLEELGIDATRFAWAAAILGTGISVDLVAKLATLRPRGGRALRRTAAQRPHPHRTRPGERPGPATASWSSSTR